MEIKKYDIIQLNSLKETVGSVQTNTNRPYLVISNIVGNVSSPILIVVPLTSKNKKRMPVHTYIRPTKESGLRCRSTVLAEQPITIARESITNVIGNVTNNVERESIDKCIMNAFFFGQNIKMEVFVNGGN